MGESELLPLKRVELPLSKFNEVAIPHHLDLLRQHKANIIKYESLGQYSRVVSEQRHSARVITQLRSLLRDMAELRQRVSANERARFDALTHTARENTLNAIVDFLESSPLAVNLASGECVSASAVSATSTESVGLVSEQELLQRECELQSGEVEVESRAAALEGWVSVGREVCALHEAWRRLHALAATQGSLAAASAARVDAAAGNVSAGRMHLASADRLRSGAFCTVGVVLGAVCGGPLAALAGAKAGLAAAAAGSILGYFGGSALDRRRRRVLAAETDTANKVTDPDTDTPAAETDTTHLHIRDEDKKTK